MPTNKTTTRNRVPKTKASKEVGTTVATAPTQYYSLKKLLATKATYMMVVGERSNGKTFAILEECIRDYFATGKQLAFLRRYREDFRSSRAMSCFDGLCEAGVIDRLSNGTYNSVYYYSGRWYMSLKCDGVEVTRASEPFAFAFSLASMEHDKGTSYPGIGNIFFDEFMSRSYPLNNEFVLFANTLSTIIRQRGDVRIFMAANTVNKSNLYITEMGLKNFKNMEQGDIDVYKYGDSGLEVAIEFSDTPSKKKPSDKYFAFGNPKLNMITGSKGGWEIGMYPHLMSKYKPSEVVYTYFIIWEEEILQCEIVVQNDDMFTFIHRKTSTIQDDNTNLVYTTEYSSKNNYRRKLFTTLTNLENKIAYFFKCDKVFYQDNEVGEIVRNFLMFSKS